MKAKNFFKLQNFIQIWRRFEKMWTKVKFSEIHEVGPKSKFRKIARSLDSFNVI